MPPKRLAGYGWTVDHPQHGIAGGAAIENIRIVITGAEAPTIHSR